MVIIHLYSFFQPGPRGLRDDGCDHLVHWLLLLDPPGHLPHLLLPRLHLLAVGRAEVRDRPGLVDEDGDGVGRGQRGWQEREWLR